MEYFVVLKRWLKMGKTKKNIDLSLMNLILDFKKVVKNFNFNDMQ